MAATKDPASIKVTEKRKPEKVAFRDFPGPASAEAAVRVAIDRQAYVDLTAHAKSSPDAEVCGVLVGRPSEDDKGSYVHVEACILGTAAKEGSTHVTFTNETWTAIHETLERDHPKLSIVGWYHTHPGFGVEFSDMDLFIQQNFFSGPRQVGLLMDPLGGAVALCANTDKGTTYVPRFWVDAREQTCWTPATKASPGDATPAPVPELAESLRAIEVRLSRIAASVDEQQASTHRLLLVATTVFCLSLIGSAGYTIYSQMAHRLEPPKVNSYVPVPVRVGDRDVLIGLAVAEWQIPPELDALFIERVKQEAIAKAALDKAAGAPSASTPTPAPPPPK